MSMFDMPEIGERIRTQDNRITANPIFLVQVKKRHYGIDTDFDRNTTWLDADEYNEVSPKKAAELEKKYQKTGEEPKAYLRVGYRDEWEFAMCFFTEAAADLYIKQNGHNHKGELRTYVISAFRNHEYNAIREWLIKQEAPVVVEATR